MDELYNLTKRMRELQRRYFKERSSQLLRECKAAEKAVDRELDRLDTTKADNHPRLFN